MSLSPTWKKSSRSASASGNCVEIATVPGAVAVRDSKDPEGPVLIIGPAAWVSFLGSIQAGESSLKA
jgi:hypothetical protein